MGRTRRGLSQWMPRRRSADITTSIPSRERRGAVCSPGMEPCVGLILFVTAVLGFARPCTASQLLVPGSGAPDIALAGSTVAEPRTASGAMFSNPAGLSLFETTTFNSSLGFGFADARVNASSPSTDDETNSVTVISPGMGLVSKRYCPRCAETLVTYSDRAEPCPFWAFWRSNQTKTVRTTFPNSS